jgi:hypothetical protein
MFTMMQWNVVEDVIGGRPTMIANNMYAKKRFHFHLAQ